MDDLVKDTSILKVESLTKNDEYDLEKWRVFEEANPNIYSAMYQFWCQKI